MSRDAYGYYRAGLTLAERDRLLSDFLGGQSYVIHQTESRIRFEQWPQSALDPTGQAFNAQLEARWWPVDDGFEMLVISDTPQTDCAGPEWTALSDLTWDKPDRGETVYLWGSHWHSLIEPEKAKAAGLDYWVQAGIPAKLRYPLPPQADRGAVQVETRTYRRQGIPQLTRFVRIESTRDPEREGGA